MKVFIIGATGYIGRVVTELLVQAGHHVYALVRSSQAAAHLPTTQVTLIPGSIADLPRLQDGLAAAGNVIYLAVNGLQGPSPEDGAATATIVQGLAGSGGVFILTSGTGVYAGTAARDVDEDTPVQGAGAAQIRRLELEQQVLAAAQQGVRSSIVRPALVYGRGGGSRLLTGLLTQARTSGHGICLGDGTNSIPVVHVDDLAAAYAQILERAPAGLVFNVSGGAVSGRDLARGISYAVGGEGTIMERTLAEGQTLLGPGAGVLASDLRLSGWRTAHLLGWTPRHPSLLYELTHGSLRAGGSEGQGR